MTCLEVFWRTLSHICVCSCVHVSCEWEKWRDCGMRLCLLRCFLPLCSECWCVTLQHWPTYPANLSFLRLHSSPFSSLLLHLFSHSYFSGSFLCSSPLAFIYPLYSFLGLPSQSCILIIFISPVICLFLLSLLSVQLQRRCAWGCVCARLSTFLRCVLVWRFLRSIPRCWCSGGKKHTGPITALRLLSRTNCVLIYQSHQPQSARINSPCEELWPVTAAAPGNPHMSMPESGGLRCEAVRVLAASVPLLSRAGSTVMKSDHTHLRVETEKKKNRLMMFFYLFSLLYPTMTAICVAILSGNICLWSCGVMDVWSWIKSKIIRFDNEPWLSRRVVFLFVWLFFKYFFVGGVVRIAGNSPGWQTKVEGDQRWIRLLQHNPCIALAAKIWDYSNGHFPLCEDFLRRVAAPSEGFFCSTWIWNFLFFFLGQIKLLMPNEVCLRL